VSKIGDSDLYPLQNFLKNLGILSFDIFIFLKIDIQDIDNNCPINRQNLILGLKDLFKFF
jgi:hypothetical protein